MKKIVSLLIVCVLALGCLPAFGEDAYLTAEEIQDYCASLLQTALTLPPVSNIIRHHEIQDIHCHRILHDPDDRHGRLQACG